MRHLRVTLRNKRNKRNKGLRRDNASPNLSSPAGGEAPHGREQRRHTRRRTRTQGGFLKWSQRHRAAAQPSRKRAVSSRRAHRMIRGILHDKGCSGRSCRGPRTFLLRVLAPGFAPFRAIWRDFRPKLVTDCLFSYEFDGRLQRSWISPAHRRFGRHRNRLFKPNIGPNRTIFPISCDPPSS